MKKIFTLCVLLALVFPTYLLAQCTSAPNGLYPSATFTPSCTGSAESIATDCYAGEYSNVSLTAGITYIFRSSKTTDFITISSGTTPLTSGTTPVTYTPTTSGTYRFYTHTGSGCGSQSQNRTRSVQCSNPPPANDEYTNAVTITPATACNSTSGTTVGATQTVAATSTCPSNSANDVWYKFTADGISSYTINATTVGISDLVLGLYSVNGTTATSIQCADALASGTETITAGTLAAGTYYYRIFGYNGAIGTFTTCVTLVTPQLTYKSSWLSMSTGSTAWCPGETRNISVTVKNVGTATWTSGSSGVNFSYWWSNQNQDYNTRILPFTPTSLGPNQQQTITFSVMAPATSGSFTLNFDLVKEGACWFRDNITNCSGPGNILYTSASQTINAFPQGSLAGSSTCSGSTGQLTFTATSGTGPFTVIYNDGTANQTANNVVSGTAFNVATNPTANTTYTLVSVANAAAAGGCLRNSGFTGSTATINVNTPPNIDVQPQPQTVCAGGTATFSVSASGTSLAYQWRKNGGNISGANSASYTTPATTAADNGALYSVVVTSGSCSVTSGAASLTVNTPPSIGTQPATQTVCAGNSVTFSVTASSTLPITGYQWKKGGVDITGATGSSYTINPVAAGDAGSYSVVVSNSCGPTTSSAATLTVNVPPAISTNPASQTKCVGQGVTFSVAVSQGTSPTYQWRRNGSPISGATTSSYTITATTAGDNGASFDVIVTVAGCSSVTSSAAILTVNTAASIAAAGQPASQTGCVGSPVSFTVTPSGTAPFTYQWKKGTTDISGATNATYTIASAASGDAGSYTVVVTNSCGTVTSNAATLTVNTPASITQQPTNQATCAGTAASFTINSTGTSPAYQWQYSTDNVNWNTGQNGSPSGFTYTTSRTNNLGTLNVTPPSNAGNGTYYYRCVIGVVGCSTPVISNAVTLTIYGTPTTSAAGSDQTICSTQSSTALAANTPATGSGAWSVVSGPNTSLSQFSSVASPTANFTPAGGAGTYKLRWTISNGSCASSTSDVNITVNAAPSINSAGQPTNKTTCAGDPKTFTVTAGGTNPTYQWQYSANGTTGWVNISDGTPGNTTYAGSTTNTLTVAPGITAAGATSYYRCVVSVASCSSLNSNAASLLVNAKPVLSVTPATSDICSGGSTTLTASGAATYQWSPSVGLSSTTSASVTASPSSTTVYSVTGTSSAGCSALYAVSATVNLSAAPTAVTVTPANPAICAGTVQALTANGGVGTATVLTQNFNGAGTPSGWATANPSPDVFGGTNGSAFNPNAAWLLQPNAYQFTFNYFGFYYEEFFFHSNDNSQFYLSNSAREGLFSSSTYTTLRSSVINTSGYQSLNLNFSQNFLPFTSDDSAMVQVSTDGTNFTTVMKYTSQQGRDDYYYTYTDANGTSHDVYNETFTATSINLNAYINKPTLYIRFKYIASNGYWWGLDNVSVTGGNAQSPITWSPTTGLYTNSAGTTPYTGGATATVYAKPSAGTTYTAGATNTAGGCTAAGSTTITVSPVSVGGSVSGNATVCSGVNSGTLALSGNTGTIVRWESSTDGGNTWVNITNATTSQSYSNITQTTQYRALVQSGNCSSAYSSAAVITVSPVTVAGVLSDNSVCSGSSGSLSLTGYTGSIVQWEQSTNGGSSWTVLSNTTATQTYSNITQNTQYRALVKSGACSSDYSSTATITIKPLPVASLVLNPVGGAACAGSPVGVVFSGTGGSTINYGISPGNPSTNIAANNGISSPNTTGDYTYTINSVTLNGCAGTISNGTQTVHIVANPDATISGFDYVQIGNQINLTGGTGGGTWSSTNTGAATIGTASGTVTGAASGTTTINYQVSNTANGVTCSSSASKTVTITADYVTRNNGNFSDYNTWKRGTVNGFVNANSGQIPTLANTIEVQHDLTLDQDFQVGMSKSFVMSAAGTLLIQPGRTFSSLGAVNFAHKAVTVQSTAAGTGAIGQMASSITDADNVTVERYTQAGTSISGRRAWRLITSPVTNRTIHEAWQEGRTWIAGGSNNVTETGTYGTLISGESLTAQQAYDRGFDYIGAGNHTSIRSYQYNVTNTGGNWAPILTNGTSAGTNVSIHDQPAYMLFVRGDRLANNPLAKSPATLRASGILNQAASTITIPGSRPYTLIGNPYAAPINFENIYNSSISNVFMVWNSSQGDYGAYNTIIRNGANNYSVIPFNSTNPSPVNGAQFIESGSGFFVSPSSGSDGSITIDESAKSPQALNGTGTFREVPVADRKLWVNLNLKDNDTASRVTDGVLVRFSDLYADGIDNDDALKQNNFNENMSTYSYGKYQTLESRSEVKTKDTVALRIWSLSKRTYQFQVKADHFSTGMKAYLEDNYLGTKQELSLQGGITTVDFSVTDEAGSYKLDRFRIVFQNNAVALPVTLTSVKAAAQNGGVNVSWTVTNEVNIKGYTIEKSVDGGRTFAAHSSQQLAHNNPNAAITSYNGYDAKPILGNNFYRIRIEAKNGIITYSDIVMVTMGSNTGIQIAVYPNPVRDGKVNLTLTNLVAGSYLASVYSNGGQVVYQRKIIIGQSNTVQSEELKIGKGLAQGNYQLRITDSKGVVVKETSLIVGR